MTSKKYFKYWGKFNQKDGKKHLLVYHLLDVAAVSWVYLSYHPKYEMHLANECKVSPTLIRHWSAFFMALHDAGKFSSQFQFYRKEIAEEQGLTALNQEIHSFLRHDSLGYLLWKEPFYEALKKKKFPDLAHYDPLDLFQVLDPIASLVTGHHGIPPSLEKGYSRHKSFNFFLSENIEAAFELVQDLKEMFLPTSEFALKSLEHLNDLPQILLKNSWSLAGFAVLADWIGSNESYFPYRSDLMPLNIYWEEVALKQAELALKASGMIQSKVSSYPGFKEIFSEIQELTPLQKHVQEMTLSESPKLFILEDVTGAGKTEAAWILTHRLAEKGLASGVYIGLPTMATANSIYARMSQVYRSLYVKESDPSLILAHSSRHLCSSFKATVIGDSISFSDEESDFGGVAYCAQWISKSSKRALLAEVGIGTIDQALLSVLRVRHQALRLFALKDKVIVIDEVHSYDAYSLALLTHLLQIHAQNQGSVILLSATLSGEAKRQLIQAYQKGLKGRRFKSSIEPVLQYPLVTVVDASEIVQRSLETREEVKRAVRVEMIDCEQEAVDIINRAVLEGKCICWIRNTVEDCRRMYSKLFLSGEVIKEKLHLFHSRYSLEDRLRIEDEIIEYFGKRSSLQERQGRVLLATQVVEQSLDLDFDLIITDLAPVDLILQRAGRLQRHQRDALGRVTRDLKTVVSREAVLYLYGPTPSDRPSSNWYKNVFPGANCVYPNTGQLWLTQKALLKEGGFTMPDSARSLIEYVYGADYQDLLPAALLKASLNQEGIEQAEKSIALHNKIKIEGGYFFSDEWEEDRNISTRLGEETRDVYMAVYRDGAIIPLSNALENPWDLSSISVPLRKLKSLKTKEKDPYEDMLKIIYTKEKFDENFDLVMPLIDKEGLLCAEGVKEDGSIVSVAYSFKMGLLLDDEIGKYGVIN